jgi:hypothetical protein
MTWKFFHAMIFCSQRIVLLKILKQRIQLLISLIEIAYTTKYKDIFPRHQNR